MARGDRFRVDVESVALDVDEPWPGAEVPDDFGRGGEGVWSGDDLVLRANAHRLQRQVQRRGAGVDRHSVRGPDAGGEFTLEPVGHSARGYPARTQGPRSIRSSSDPSRSGLEKGRKLSLTVVLYPVGRS